jgi:hypothetical protein
MSKWMRLLVTTGMLYAGLVAIAPAVRAGGLEEEGPKCCSLGEQCPGEQLCCSPSGIGALACSQQLSGYCLDTCH